MAESVVREEHAVKTRRVAVTENLKPADGYTALVKAHVLACMCPSGGVVLPMREQDGRYHDCLRTRWRTRLHGRDSAG